MESTTLARTFCRRLIRLSSRFVPAPFRSGWRRHYEDEIEDWALLVDRGDILPQSRPLLAFTLSVAAATLRKRLQVEANPANARRLAGTPAFAMSVVLSAALALAALSGGFRGFRAMLAPLPYKEPGRVVEFRAFVPFLGLRNAIPAETLEFWRKGSRDIEEFAGYSIQGHVMRVTPGFFRVLGIEPASGRLIGDGDRPGCCAVVREGGSAANLIGTVPRGFWFKSRQVDTWVPLGDAGEGVLIARLKPGVSAAHAQQELRKLAQTGIFRPVLRRVQAMRVELRPLNEIFRFPLYVAGGGLAFSLILLALYTGVAALVAKPRPHWRYWAFLMVKTSAVMLVFAVAWVEIAAWRAASPTRLDGPALSLIGDWTFLLVYVGAVWQSLRDQRRRCPVCLNRLSVPVSIGSWSSPLMNPASTELLCLEGHGTLFIPETQSSDREPERWQPIETSWKEAFKIPGQTA